MSNIRQHVTKHLKLEIERYARNHPDADDAHIAKVFNVNLDRVSEILNGNQP